MQQHAAQSRRMKLKGVTDITQHVVFHLPLPLRSRHSAAVVVRVVAAIVTLM